MEQFDEKELANLFHLCRIECTEEEKKKLLGNLRRVLSYIGLLEEVDTGGVKPCNHLVETIANVLREDAIGELLPRETFLANSPSHVGGMIKVPPVMKPSQNTPEN
jgi:aspartyl-tRNA(Asn)/glutamyl-tRNA(Gln) amidotransferase subunit C